MRWTVEILVADVVGRKSREVQTAQDIGLHARRSGQKHLFWQRSLDLIAKEHGLAGCDSAVVKVIVQTPIGQDVGHRHIRVLGPLFEFRSQQDV